ncbi:hypothetical protein HDU77_005973 [Chytriomyces hyalinus]|nr:hypothetical protein HDU77_005973 [Chytriomyces hyalinus]
MSTSSSAVTTPPFPSTTLTSGLFPMPTIAPLAAAVTLHFTDSRCSRLSTIRTLPPLKGSVCQPTKLCDRSADGTGLYTQIICHTYFTPNELGSYVSNIFQYYKSFIGDVSKFAFLTSYSDSACSALTSYSVIDSKAGVCSTETVSRSFLFDPSSANTAIKQLDLYPTSSCLNPFVAPGEPQTLYWAMFVPSTPPCQGLWDSTGIVVEFVDPILNADNSAAWVSFWTSLPVTPVVMMAPPPPPPPPVLPPTFFSGPPPAPTNTSNSSTPETLTATASPSFSTQLPITNVTIPTVNTTDTVASLGGAVTTTSADQEYPSTYFDVSPTNAAPPLGPGPVVPAPPSDIGGIPGGFGDNFGGGFLGDDGQPGTGADGNGAVPNGIGAGIPLGDGIETGATPTESNGAGVGPAEGSDVLAPTILYNLSKESLPPPPLLAMRPGGDSIPGDDSANSPPGSGTGLESPKVR